MLPDKGIGIVHSPYFVLEYPIDQIKVESWVSDPYVDVRQWRYEKVPQGTDGERAQVMRASWEDDEEGALEVMQLVSENVERFMRPQFYDFLTSVLTDPTFHLYSEEQNPDGDPSNIGIFDGGKLVGAFTPLLKRTQWHAESE